MGAQRINRLSSFLLILLSATALITVITGLIWPPPVPELDEGIQAHVFQLSIAGLLPMAVIVVGTADWRRPWSSLLPLAIAFIAALLAFVGLYFLEHVR